jgi:hypothetical protein
MNFLLNFSFGSPFQISHIILAKNLEIQDFNYKNKKLKNLLTAEKLSIKSDEFIPSRILEISKTSPLLRGTLRNHAYNQCCPEGVLGCSPLENFVGKNRQSLLPPPPWKISLRKDLKGKI